MKERKLLFILFLVFIYSIGFIHNSYTCSMFKITLNGKTMVGNNEDYWNPNTRIWFEKGKSGKYGVAYVGFDNFWPQGGMNEAGLVFDGFSMDYLAIKDTSGKISLSMDFLKEIMEKYSSVNEVKKYFANHNLSGLETSMYLFVDKTGKYLVVQGDSLITGNNQHYILSNFYPSKIKNESEIDIPYYHKAKRLLENSGDTNIGFCSSVMDTMHQERDWGGGTMYTTLYDLKDGLIYLYFFHDYQHVVQFNLKDELEKGDHVLIIPKLFSENKKGCEFFSNYNEVSNSLDLFKNDDVVGDSLRYTNVISALFSNDVKLIRTFEGKINDIGNIWFDKNKYAEAIVVFNLYLKVIPNSWNAFDSLAKAYFKNGQPERALTYFEKSLEINPNNSYAKEKIEELKRLSKKL